MYSTFLETSSAPMSVPAASFTACVRTRRYDRAFSSPGCGIGTFVGP
jgi:hypothetical protein